MAHRGGTGTPRRPAPGAPRTPAGGWSVILAIVSWAGLIGLVLAWGFGLQRPVAFTDNWLVSGWAMLVLVGAVVATGLGLHAMVAHRDRGWSVVAATVLAGLLALLQLREAIQGLVGSR